ncbi:Protein RRP5 [Orchesella cincta]|uniref:Protein RRP5 n=1 Tax=Orchesella cincta TaxID=48709 RepID=A0A1D2MIG3_ORCCI|nr:Protein RRP5 [Orchesella cincta]
MVNNEEYFPRGKAPPAVAKADKSGGSERGTQVGKRVKLGNKLENLFANTDEKPKKAKNKKNKLTPGEEKILAGNRRGPEEKKFSVVPLTYDQIVEGMLSVGVVSRIKDHELYVSLPGRTGGTVSITNISSPYLKVLEKYAGGKEAMDEDLCIYTLKDMFQIGQQVVVKVIKVERSDTTTKISLSMNPMDLHEFYSTTVLKEDLVMIAAVESKEDHGYVMDVGINGARCFLPNAEVNKFLSRVNNNRQFGVGQLVYCKIKRVQFHRLIANVTFTIMPKLVRLQKMDEITSLNYSTLIPGMLVDAIVMETHRTGIMVHCMDLNGLVYQDHLVIAGIPGDLGGGSTVPARILYTLPNLTSPYLTLQADLLPLAQSGDRTDLNKLGAKLEVRIVRTEKRGVIVRFADEEKGIIPINHIGNEALLTSDDISKKFKKNSVHPCRVLQYSPIERMYLCTFRKDKLESDVCHVQQATCGKVVTCKIVGFNKGGACVQFGSGMHGFIPNTLLKNKTLTEAAKEKLVGTSVKARIMERDISLDKVVLTAHKELVASNGAVITSVEEAEIGMKGHAVIKSFNKGGAYVNAIGGVEGFIPASKLNRVRLADFKEAHHVGQIIEYKVLEKVPEKNHLLLTAIIEDEEVPQKKSGRKEKRKLSVISDSDAQKENGEESGLSKKKKIKKNKKKTKSDASIDACESEAEDAEVENEVEPEIKADPDIKIENESMSLDLDVPETDTFWNGAVEVKDEPVSDLEEDLDTSKSTKQGQKASHLVVADLSSKTNSISKSESEKVLESASKFERGEITSPNDPNYWLELMTHYSSLGNVDKARGVAKQALSSMDYRNEKAKLRVWGGLLQMEVKYGTEESVKIAFADALQRNDEFECFKMMALVYDTLNRKKDAERTYRQMTKKFRLEPEAWIRFGLFYFMQKNLDSGRELLNQALSAVADAKKVYVITKFALLEMHHGEQTKGEEMLGRVLEQYPQRSDIWLLYLNALIKAGELDKARATFHRAFEVKWSPRKVKPLLQRFQSFENEYGDDLTLAEFQNCALKVLSISSNN